MPTVESKTGQVNLTVQAELLKVKNHVTAAEVDAVTAACIEYSNLSKATDKAEKLRNKLLASIFEKTLGLKDSAEIKKMSGEDVAKLLQERFTAGLFTYDKEFNLKQTSARRSPNYQQHLINLVGSAKVIEIQEKEPYSYSYIVVAVAEPQK